MAHHQEAGDVHADFAGEGDVLGGDVGLGAVRGYPNRTHTEVVGVAQIVDGADAGEQQRGQPGILQCTRGGFEPLPIGVAARPVGEAAAVQTVAVRDLHRVDARRIQRGGNGGNVFRGDAVAQRVHTVAQRHILQKDFCHYTLSRIGTETDTAARCSATRNAAEVMMSRFPA